MVAAAAAERVCCAWSLLYSRQAHISASSAHDAGREFSRGFLVDGLEWVREDGHTSFILLLDLAARLPSAGLFRLAHLIIRVFWYGTSPASDVRPRLPLDGSEKIKNALSLSRGRSSVIDRLEIIIVLQQRARRVRFNLSEGFYFYWLYQQCMSRGRPAHTYVCLFILCVESLYFICIWPGVNYIYKFILLSCSWPSAELCELRIRIAVLAISHVVLSLLTDKRAGN